MEVKYINSAIANNFGTHIELNRHLKEFPELHHAILEHELSHTDKQGFTREDLVVDLKPTNVNNFQLLKFIFKHPLSLTQFSPITYRNGTLFYDINSLIIWGIGILAVLGTIIFAL